MHISKGIEHKKKHIKSKIFQQKLLQKAIKYLFLIILHIICIYNLKAKTNFLAYIKSFLQNGVIHFDYLVIFSVAHFSLSYFTKFQNSLKDVRHLGHKDCARRA